MEEKKDQLESLRNFASFERLGEKLSVTPEKEESDFVMDIDKFFVGWVKKDTHPLRKKDVWADNIYDWMRQHPNVYQGTRRTQWFKDTFTGYHEDFWTGNVDGIEVRYVWCCARLGIPSLIIGTRTKKDWIEIRTKLRAAGLIREK